LRLLEDPFAKQPQRDGKKDKVASGGESLPPGKEDRADRWDLPGEDQTNTFEVKATYEVPKVQGGILFPLWETALLWPTQVL